MCEYCLACGNVRQKISGRNSTRLPKILAAVSCITILHLPPRKKEIKLYLRKKSYRPKCASTVWPVAMSDKKFLGEILHACPKFWLQFPASLFPIYPHEKKKSNCT